jgi:hypothetical protein
MRNTFEVPAAIFSTSPKPFADAYWRRCFRVLRMVGVLHGKGFHGLRIFPYNYPLAYRIENFPARYSKPDEVKYEIPDEKLVARHSGANERKYFGVISVWGGRRKAGREALPSRPPHN